MLYSKTWLFTSHNVLSSLPPSELSRKIVNLDLLLQSIEIALGISWNIEQDTFVFKPIENDIPVTKRGIISLVSSIFSPLGILTPLILEAKLIIQYF